MFDTDCSRSTTESCLLQLPRGCSLTSAPIPSFVPSSNNRNDGSPRLPARLRIPLVDGHQNHADCTTDIGCCCCCCCKIASSSRSEQNKAAAFVRRTNRYGPSLVSGNDNQMIDVVDGNRGEITRPLFCRLFDSSQSNLEQVAADRRVVGRANSASYPSGNE